MNTSKGIAASIHLYGTSKAGFDTIVAFYDANGTTTRMIGNGQNLCPMRSATDAIFLAVSAINDSGVRRGTVEVHYDFFDGARVARFKLEKAAPYFGDLKWEKAAVLTISVDALIAAAENV